MPTQEQINMAAAFTKLNSAMSLRAINLASVGQLAAYTGAETTVSVVEMGTFDLLTSVAVPDGVNIVAAKNQPTKRWLVRINGPINVKRFGAKGDRITDDTAGIQNAINFAKTQGVSAVYKRVAVYFPFGDYRVTNTNGLNCTDANGLTLIGDGRYFQSNIIGETGGLVVDFSGSTLSGMANLCVASYNEAYEAMSTIGVQFALSKDSPNQQTAGVQKGGLNCRLDNVSILLGSKPTANAGIGTIPVLNCRAEEFTATAIYTGGNTGFVFTNRRDLGSFTNYNYTVSSAYVPIQDDNIGSMGVIDVQGHVSCFERNSPAFIMDGTNGFRFRGYVGRILSPASPTNNGTYETAFKFTQQTFGVNIEATVESYSEVAHFQNNFENVKIDVTFANCKDATRPIVRLDNSGLVGKNLALEVGFGNPPEMNNRYLVWCESGANNDVPVPTTLLNSWIVSSSWPNNRAVAPLWLTRNFANVRYEVGQPIEYEGGWVKQRFRYPVAAGVLGNITTAQLMRFDRADRNTRTHFNAGDYTIRVKGTIAAGSSDSGARATAYFEGVLNYAQITDSSQGTFTAEAQIISKCATFANSIDITGITLSLDTTDASVFKVNALPAVIGGNGPEPIIVDATVEVRPNFSVLGTVIYV